MGNKGANCSVCVWMERIEGKNEVVICNFDEETHNIEASCIQWLPED